MESADFSDHEYHGIGAYMISLGCSPDEADESLGTVRKLLADLDAEGITEAELELAKTKIAVRTVLAAERPRKPARPAGLQLVVPRTVPDGRWRTGRTAVGDGATGSGVAG